MFPCHLFSAVKRDYPALITQTKSQLNVIRRLSYYQTVIGKQLTTYISDEPYGQIPFCTLNKKSLNGSGDSMLLGLH